MTTAHPAPQYFNIKVVARATGLNAATIRTWERRYGLPTPDRSQGGQRQYTQADIDALKWLLARQAEGLSIRHAAERWHAQAQGVPAPLATTLAVTTATPAAPAALPRLELIRQQWLAAALAFQRQAAEAILAEAFAYFAPELVCTELLQKAMATLGQQWAAGTITIQQEHFASALAVRRLEGLIAATPQPETGTRLLVCCAPGDHHIFSPLLLTYLLLRGGWDVYYLGANVPATAMEATVAQIQPHLVILAAQQLPSAANLMTVATALTAAGVAVGYGGLIFNQLPGLQARIPGIFLGRTLTDALTTVRHRFSAGALPVPQSALLPLDHQLVELLAHYAAQRAHIEAYLWEAGLAAAVTTETLMAINDTFAATIMAALKFGELAFAGETFAAVEHLLISYRPPQVWLAHYLAAYQQAAQLHLGSLAAPIVTWLGGLLATLPHAEPAVIALTA